MISSITPFTLQDYPDHTACILWFRGCNFRCDYCHNPELISAKGKKLSAEKVMDFLNSRKNLLNGVVFSGGECTLYPQLFELINKIKQMGFLIKLDSNGSRPQKIKELIENDLLDYIALDYKAPKSKFFEITKYKSFEDFDKSLNTLCQSNVNFEVRTTIHTELLDENDINEIIKDLENRGFNKNFYLQNFTDNGTTFANLEKQSRKLNLDKIINPKSFKMNLRNF